MNVYRPRYRVQKYVTAIQRRKLVKNCGGGQVPKALEWRRRRRRRERGLGPQKKIFDFVLRNVELLCILDSGAGRQYSNCNHDVHDIGTYQCRIDRLVIPIFYYCVIMLANVASTPLSCTKSFALSICTAGISNSEFLTLTILNKCRG